MTIIAGLVIAMVANWKLSLIVLVLLPFLSLQGYVQVRLLAGVGADVKVMHDSICMIP